MIDLTSSQALLLRENEHVAETTSRWAFVTPAKQQILLHWLIIILVSVLTTTVMWEPALLWGDSAWYDLTRVVEFDAAIRSGDFFPTWSPDLYHGYGSPLFQFYSPLVYFIAEIPLLAGVDVASAIKLVQLAMLIASGLAMYQFASANASRWAASFAAVLYIVAPYRMLNLFGRHALAEHAAFIWLPLLVLGTQRFVANRGRAGALTAIVATAGLVLTHNVMALIALPTCLAAGWLLAARANDWKSILLAGCPAAIGLGTTAFFWWPALSARSLTCAEASLTGGYFDFHHHFVETARLLGFRSMFGDGSGSPGEMPLHIGLPHLLVAMAALVLLHRKWRTRWGAVAVAITAGGLLMCHAISQPVWENLPLLKYVQFPWRFLGLVVFGAAICGAVVVDRVRSISPRLELPLVLSGMALVLAAYFPSYATAQFVAADLGTSTIIRVTPEQVNELEAKHRLIPLDRLVTREAIRSAGERATSSDDFLPRDVQEKPTAPSTEPVSTNAGHVIRCERPALNRYRATVSMREAGAVQLHQFWFPGWTARLDGCPISVTRSGKSAIVSCNVPAGDHAVEFEYTSLPQRQAGLIVSCVSILAAAAMFRLGKSPRQFATGCAP